MTDDDVDAKPAGGGLAGDIRMLAGVRSPELGNTRDVLVYLPPAYRQGGGPYPVLYMHDGQNLFDPSTAFAGEWRVNDTLERMSAEGLEAVVVGVPNMGAQRVDEYSPFRDDRRGGGRGDAYLDFLVRTLKPMVDRRFRTMPDVAHTGILGSSMGGLISLYGFFRHPDVFGIAGAMSPSLWFADRAVFACVGQRPGWTGRVHLDVGTAEGRVAVRDARAMARLLRRTAASPRPSVNYLEERGARHHEAAWARRFELAARFLLARGASSTTPAERT